MITGIFIGILVGAIAGAAAVYFFLRANLGREKTEALAQQRELLEQRIRDHELSEQKVKDQFSLLAQDILSKNIDSQVKAFQTQNNHDLEKKKQEFNQSFEEIKNTLKSTGEKIQNFERERTDQYAKIEKQIQTMATQEQKLIQETERLKSALTTSQSVRGRWGELVLRNILQQSGLVHGIDYEEQAATTGNEGNLLKPDFVIKLPHSGQHLVIDSKASIFESYLESEAQQTDNGRKQLHQDFANRLKERVKDLSSKEYQKFVTDSVPYVILFVPSEAAIRAAFDVDPLLFQWSMDRKVFISSPATILPLITLIANGWQQHKLSEKANELAHVVEILGDRLKTFVTRLAGVGKGIDAASRAWNEAIDKSWNGNQSVQKSIDKARELGGNIGDIPSLGPAESNPRILD
ncbi:MAG: DNA recombination protein RmuC [Bdellovibrionales bacterium]|nr:DNA recombination protein RmuC [Bdellovibrionales bacterium]